MNEFLTIFLVFIVFIAIAFILFAIRILIKKNGRFSSQDVGQSKAMKKRGIYCAQTQDKLAQHNK